MKRETLLGNLGAAGFAAGIGLGMSVPAHAQDDIAALRAQITAMQARLDKLEADQKAAAAAAPAAAKTGGPAVTSKMPVTLTGLLQAQGNAFLSQDGTTKTPATARQVSTLRLRRAEIRLTATISPRITAGVMLDPAKALGNFPSNVPGTIGAVNQSTNVLQELQLSYQLNQRAANSMYFDVGQFKIPIGYEGDLVSSSALPTIERGLIYQVRDPAGGGLGDIRDTGFQLRGTAGSADYRLGLFNGLGERQNAGGSTADNKALIGRLVFHPSGASGFQFGVSGARANLRNTTLPGFSLPGIPATATSVPFPVPGAFPGSQDAKRTVSNLFAVYKRNKDMFAAEYTRENFSGSKPFSAASAAAPTRNVAGYYALYSHSLKPRLEGVLRYDSFKLDRNIANTTVHQALIGVNYYIKGNYAKLQANLIRQNGAGGITSGNNFLGSQTQTLQRASTILRTQLQTSF